MESHTSIPGKNLGMQEWGFDHSLEFEFHRVFIDFHSIFSGFSWASVHQGSVVYNFLDVLLEVPSEALLVHGWIRFVAPII